MAAEFDATCDLGTWCIYSESNHEIVPMGFEIRPSENTEQLLAEEYHARPLEVALRNEYYQGDLDFVVSATAY